MYSTGTPRARAAASSAFRRGMTPRFCTVSRWLNEEDPLGAIRRRGAPMPLDIKALLANSVHDARDPARPWLLAPVDLQAVKACGVTYIRSMLERVIEERCRGDASQAEAVRAEAVGRTTTASMDAVAAWLRERKIRRVILVSDPFHMFRLRLEARRTAMD